MTPLGNKMMSNNQFSLKSTVLDKNKKPILIKKAQIIRVDNQKISLNTKERMFTQQI